MLQYRRTPGHFPCIARLGSPDVLLAMHYFVTWEIFLYQKADLDKPRNRNIELFLRKINIYLITMWGHILNFSKLGQSVDRFIVGQFCSDTLFGSVTCTLPSLYGQSGRLQFADNENRKLKPSRSVCEWKLLWKPAFERHLVSKTVHDKHKRQKLHYNYFKRR